MSFHILLNGAKGRMGQAILKHAADAGATGITEIDAGDDPALGLEACDVVIDFSFHEATSGLVELAAAAGKPLVIGTTGHTADERRRILAASARIPMVWSGNYSVGVNLLFHLVRQAASVLPAAYHAEIVEMHHRMKRDAPSGTAERLIEVIRETRNLSPEQVRHGRSGITGMRPDEEIGVHALRGGDVVGDHTVMFAGPGERVELAHRASDRGIFATGALRAARWIIGRPPGHYLMEDVLGLRGRPV